MGFPEERSQDMRQMDLPALHIHSNGTWTVDLPRQKHRNILANYPLGDPMYGFIQAINNDFTERKNNLESALQAEIELVNDSYPPLQKITPDTWLSRASDVVNELLLRKNTELQKEIEIIQNHGGYDQLQASYNSVILRDQIASLNERLAKLNVEIGRRQAEATRQAADQASAALAESRRIAEQEARRLAEAQIDEYKRGLSFVADVNKYILEQYGEITHQVGKDLQSGISGKKIRNYTEAMQTFEKVRSNPNARLNAKDTQAVVEALNALNKSTYSENLNRLAKGFGVTGRIVQAHSVVEKAIIGFQEGNWKPLMLELESIAAGAGAGALLAAVLALFYPAVAASALGIVAVALLTATISSILDANQVDIINNAILNEFRDHQPQ